jgi:tRNA-dihydrouridine synthase
MIAETGCDAVMIGRAAPANPWIFRQIAQYTAFGTYDQPTAMDRYHMIRDYFLMLMEEDQNAATSGKMKQFASWFTHGVPGGAILRKSIYEAKSSAAVLTAVDAFFASPCEAETETEQLQAAVV